MTNSYLFYTGKNLRPTSSPSKDPEAHKDPPIPGDPVVDDPSESETFDNGDGDGSGEDGGNTSTNHEVEGSESPEAPTTAPTLLRTAVVGARRGARQGRAGGRRNKEGKGKSPHAHRSSRKISPKKKSAGGFHSFSEKVRSGGGKRAGMTSSSKPVKSTSPSSDHLNEDSDYANESTSKNKVPPRKAKKSITLPPPPGHLQKLAGDVAAGRKPEGAAQTSTLTVPGPGAAVDPASENDKDDDESQWNFSQKEERINPHPGTTRTYPTSVSEQIARINPPAETTDPTGGDHNVPTDPVSDPEHYQRVGELVLAKERVGERSSSPSEDSRTHPSSISDAEAGPQSPDGAGDDKPAPPQALKRSRKNAEKRDRNAPFELRFGDRNTPPPVPENKAKKGRSENRDHERDEDREDHDKEDHEDHSTHSSGENSKDHEIVDKDHEDQTTRKNREEVDHTTTYTSSKTGGDEDDIEKASEATRAERHSIEKVVDRVKRAAEAAKQAEKAGGSSRGGEASARSAEPPQETGGEASARSAEPEPPQDEASARSAEPPQGPRNTPEDNGGGATGSESQT